MLGVAATLSILLVARLGDDGDGDGDGGDGIEVASTSPGPTVSTAPDDPPTPAGIAVDGLGFTDVTTYSGLARRSEGTVTSATPVDIDADGDLDLFVTRAGGSDSLYRNDGSGRFDDLAEDFGLSGPGGAGTAGAAVADLDGDGCLDAATVPVDAAEPRVGRNTCWGRFEPVGTGSATGGEADPGPEQSIRRSPLAADLDADGDVDVVVVSDSDAIGVAVFLNDGSGRLADGSAEWMAAVDDRPVVAAFLGDLDGDGRPDLAMRPRVGDDRLLINRGGSAWAEAGAGTPLDAAGAAIDARGNPGVLPTGRPDAAASRILLRIDLGGPLRDAVLAADDTGDGALAVWRAEGDGWSDVAVEIGLAEGAVAGVRAADVDGDGDVDLVTWGRADSGTVALWRSDLA